MVFLGKSAGLALAVIAATLAIGASRATAACDAAEAAAVDRARPLEILPVAFVPISTPVHPVKGTDGRVHLAYEFAVSNVTPVAVRIVSVEVVDARSGEPSGRNVVVGYDGQDVAGQVSRFARRDAGVASDSFGTRLPPGQGGYMYFDVVYPNAAAVPCRIAHRVTVELTGVEGKPRVVTVAAPLPVGDRPAIVIRPPLRGPRWFDLDSCCAAIGAHRFTLLTPFGRYRDPETFAIDYVQLTEGGRTYTGDIKVLRNWPSYGKPIYAVADGRVSSIENGLPDIVPGGKPAGLPASQAGGNYVIQKIADGQYAFYAHMIPGSVRVRAGQMVRAGQLLGRLGNSGNSDGPHLHFQIMSAPSALDAAGLPFVYDDVWLEGRFVGTARAADELFLDGGRHRFDRRDAGRQRHRMPIAGDLMRLR